MDKLVADKVKLSDSEDECDTNLVDNLNRFIHRPCQSCCGETNHQTDPMPCLRCQ